MTQNSIYIKNMVCPRCIMAVEQILNNLEIPYTEIKLGEVILNTDNFNYSELNNKLKSIGFEIIHNKNKILSEQIKNLIIDLIHQNKGDNLKINIPEYISSNLKHDYSYLSSIFSKTENTTIKKYIILQKIEKVKELIDYNELTFSEIAFNLNYSSISHLSKQFKKITNFTLTEYKTSHNSKRKPLDKI